MKWLGYIFVLMWLQAAAFAADDSHFVAIASYINSPKIFERDEKRAIAILEEHKILFEVSATFGATMYVQPSRAEEAQKLLASAIKTEGLKLTLLTRKGNRYITLTPEEVLKPEAKTGG